MSNIRTRHYGEEELECESDYEIRESIPCYVQLFPARTGEFERPSTVECLPVGYTLDEYNGVVFRGVRLYEGYPNKDGESYRTERLYTAWGAWDHAIWRERVRRGIVKLEDSYRFPIVKEQKADGK